MPLSSGSKLGPYEIVAPVGAGGMGEVYRARDTRLERSVAIKIVSGDVATNPELRARFEREARALSSLSHPNICALYDIGRENGSEYLVMEYLEGETLAHRLERGALPIRELLKTGVEIADALDKAHRQGLVHRDLKPGNIMLTKSGAKLLDFGLAKAQTSAMAASATLDAATAAHPTSPITQQGFLVGTFQYMSPEQVQGKEADSRSDIFAFGAVLYEMATGKRAFDGKSQIGIASAILEKDPEPISSIHALAPPALEHIVDRALAKDPDERWQSASDIKAELKWITASGSQPGLARAIAAKKSRFRASWALIGILAGLAFVLASILIERPTTPAQMVKSSILPPEGATLISSGIFAAPLELSPDGTKLLFVVSKGEEPQMIWVRHLDTGEVKELAGTEGASRPFWSHDGKSIGFFADRKLKKIDADGGPVFTLANAFEGRGGTWNAQGMILFSPAAYGSLFVVSGAGGPVRQVTKLDPAEHETTHRWPEFLPDGKHFLFLTRHSGAGAGVHPAIEVGSLDGGEPKHLLEAASNVKYASGYLLYVREHALIAQKFDDKRLAVVGDPIILSDDVRMDERFTRAVFTVSQNGVLAYETGTAREEYELRVISRSDADTHAGKALGEAAQFFNGGDPHVSPDGKSALAAIVDLRSGESDMWRVDLSTGNRERLTNGADVYTAAWSPDGKQFSFAQNRDSTQIMIQPASGLGAAQQAFLLNLSDLPEVASWTPDGRNILYLCLLESTNHNVLWSLPVGGGKPAELFNDSASYSSPVVSPDDHFLAFVSDETGRDEVYVTPYPAVGRRWRISQNGGVEPRWRRDGKELFFFAADNRLQVVPLKISGSEFEVGQPQPLFSASKKGVGIWRYDVLPDGQHFVVATASGKSPSNITLVTNWTNLLSTK